MDIFEFWFCYILLKPPISLQNIHPCLEIIFISDFYNDPLNLAASIEIQIQSKFVQVDTQYHYLLSNNYFFFRSTPLASGLMQSLVV